jgi:RNA polymerase sigma-70 factor (ECF subfamily)
MRDVTLSEIEQLRAEAGAADAVFEMDEAAFRALYDRTARALWGYLARMTGSADAADDLLQETYYRFLRSRSPYENDAHRRNALFRIATNLARDCHRRDTRARLVAIPDEELIAAVDIAAQTERRQDLARAMSHLRPRERAMLWLAYAQGSTHRDIASMVGVKTESVRLLLFRARHKLAELLRGGRRRAGFKEDASERREASHANGASRQSGSRESVLGSPRGEAPRSDHD